MVEVSRIAHVSVEWVLSRCHTFLTGHEAALGPHTGGRTADMYPYP
jgi:hypothetical protein